MMRSTSPMNRTPQSPVVRTASPRPPLHPRTNLSVLDSPRARTSSPIATRRAVTPPPSGGPPQSPRDSSPKTGSLANETGYVQSSSVLRRKSSTQSLDQPKMVTRVKLPHESVRSLFWSPLGLLVFFAGALVITGISQTGFSVKWLYNGSKYPMISCPSRQFLFGPSENVDGSHCLLLLVGQNREALRNVDSRITIGNPAYYGTVVYAAPCSVADSMVSPTKCTFTAWSNDFPSPPSTGTACKFNVMPVCDSDASVSVGQILTLQGLGLTGAFIIVVYFLIALIATTRYKRTLHPSRQRRLDVSRSAAEAIARRMAEKIEHEWTQLEIERSVSRKSNKKQSQPLKIPELFTSNSWKYKLSKSLGTEARARRNVVLFLQKLRTGVAVWAIFFALTVGVMQLFLFILPRNYYANTPRSVFSSFLYDRAFLGSGKTVNSGSTWVDLVAVADVFSEFFSLLFSVVFCGVFQWPSLSVKASHLVKTRSSIRRGSEVDFRQASADGAIYAETVAAVLLVQENCSSDHRKNSLAKIIQNLLTMFPPDSIFVVDSHQYSSTPVDTTWETVNKLSPLIKYCFVPETDSRLFALYWFSAVWFPFLLESGQIDNFSHFLVISPTDEDGGILPLLPPELTIPRESLSVNADNLRALHLPIQASLGHSSSGCCWLPCQDYDLKFRAIRRLAESRLGSCSEVELSVGIWEREALIKALTTATSRDTGSPLQQMQAGLNVVKMRARNHIKSIPHAFVSVSVPGSFTDFATQRFRSNNAGDIVRVGCALREFFSVFSLCNVYSWSVKPFMLLGTVVSGICQFARPFVIGTLVFRDPIAIACLAVLAMVMIILLELILFLVFSNRKDLRQKWSFMSIIAYPVYRAVKCWLVELPTLFEYIMGGCVRNTSIRPEKRAGVLQDMPACPPCHVVNWFTVWKIEEVSEFTEKHKIQTLEDTMSSLGTNA